MTTDGASQRHKSGFPPSSLPLLSLALLTGRFVLICFKMALTTPPAFHPAFDLAVVKGGKAGCSLEWRPAWLCCGICLGEWVPLMSVQDLKLLLLV